MQTNLSISRRMRQLLLVVSLNFHWLKIFKRQRKAMYIQKNDLKEKNRFASDRGKYIDWFARQVIYRIWWFSKMGKVAQRKLNRNQRYVLEEILSDDHNDSVTSAASSNIYSASSTGSSNIYSASSTGSSDINSIALTGSLNINPTTHNLNVSAGDDLENADYPQQSNVWKYATKLALEKASCNICNAG